MRARMISTAVFCIFVIATLAFGEELPLKYTMLEGDGTIQLLKQALPQMVFILVLVTNLLTALIDSDRNFKASLISTIIIIAITQWGGFYKPLFDVLAART